jgi:hypothetical protein
MVMSSISPSATGRRMAVASGHRACHFASGHENSTQGTTYRWMMVYRNSKYHSADDGALIATGLTRPDLSP